MNHSRTKLCAANDILYTEPRGNIGAQPIGVLYGLDTDLEAGIIRSKIALSDGGTHRGIYDSLHDKGLVEKVAQNALLYVPVGDENNSCEMYTFHGVREDGAPYVVYGAEANHDNSEIELRANLAARALVLALGTYYQTQPEVWTPDQLQSVPDEDIIV